MAPLAPFSFDYHLRSSWPAVISIGTVGSFILIIIIVIHLRVMRLASRSSYSPTVTVMHTGNPHQEQPRRRNTPNRHRRPRHIQPSYELTPTRRTSQHREHTRPPTTPHPVPPVPTRPMEQDIMDAHSHDIDPGIGGQ